MIGPGQQVMILGRNANKIKKALAETQKVRLVKKSGIYWLAPKPCQSAGSPAKGAGSAAPLAAVGPAAKTVPARACRRRRQSNEWNKQVLGRKGEEQWCMKDSVRWKHFLAYTPMRSGT